MDKIAKYFTIVKFETNNTVGVVKSCNSKNESWVNINMDFIPEEEFKDNVSISIYDKEGNEVLNQDTLGSINIKANNKYLNNLRSKSILTALGDSYRMASDDLRAIVDIDTSTIKE